MHSGAAAADLQLVRSGAAAADLQLVHSGAAAADLQLEHIGAAAEDLQLVHSGTAAADLQLVHSGAATADLQLVTVIFDSYMYNIRISFCCLLYITRKIKYSKIICDLFPCREININFTEVADSD